ncbi:MAG: hypothetical protein WEC14_05645 [Chloroflexota bacterium]
MTDRPIDAVIARAIDAHAALAEFGEEVEDEWTYVTDLAAAWRERLESVAAERSGEEAAADVEAAVDAAIAEAALVHDPHRAIDWMSTFPQVVLIAMGERP